MEGGYKCLCLLSCAHQPLGLDGNDWGVGCRCFCCPCSLIRAKPGDMPFLVAVETKSTLYPLSFFFVRKGGACPRSPNIHGVWVSVTECVPPLELCRLCSSFTSLDSFLQVDVLWF